MKKIVLFFALALALGAQAQEKTPSCNVFEVGSGILNLHGAYYRQLSSRELLGVRTTAGFMFPVLYVDVVPSYRYYFSDFLRRNTSSRVQTRWFAEAGVNLLAVSGGMGYIDGERAKRSGGAYDADLFVAPLAGVGLEVNYRNLFIRPTLHISVPIVGIDAPDSFFSMVGLVSLTSSLIPSIAIYYRF